MSQLAVFSFAPKPPIRPRFERAKSEGDLPNDADAADLARFVTALFQGMTLQAINGASREDLLAVERCLIGNACRLGSAGTCGLKDRNN
jgi:hypothetical protein